MRQSAGRRPFGCAVALRTRSQQSGNASYDAGVKILNQFFCNCLTSSLSRDPASLGSQIIECYDIATGGGSPSASRRS